MRYVNEAGKCFLGAASALMLVFALLLGVQAISAQADNADCNGTVRYCDDSEVCAQLVFISFCKTYYYYYPSGGGGDPCDDGSFDGFECVPD